MDLRICPKGHNYNGDVNATCPICEAEKRGSMVADYGATEPLSGGFGGGAGATEPVTGGFGGGFGEEIGATEPVSGGFGGGFAGGVGPTKPVDEDFGGGFGRGVGTTEPVSNTGFGSSSDTLPPTPSAAFKNSDETMRFDENWAPGVDNYNDQTMPHNPGMVAGFTPVVGWCASTGRIRGMTTESAAAIIISAVRSIWISASAVISRSAARSTLSLPMMTRRRYSFSVLRTGEILSGSTERWL